jgi:sortase A
VQPGDGRRLVTLVTCAELFHTDDRMVAFGHLVDRESR